MIMMRTREKYAHAQAIINNNNDYSRFYKRNAVTTTEE